VNRVNWQAINRCLMGLILSISLSQLWTCHVSAQDIHMASHQEVNSNSQHLILVVIPGLSFIEWDMIYPHLSIEAIKGLNMGAVNIRTGGGMNSGDNLATLLTGMRISEQKFVDTYQQEKGDLISQLAKADIDVHILNWQEEIQHIAQLQRQHERSFIYMTFNELEYIHNMTNVSREMKSKLQANVIERMAEWLDQLHGTLLLEEQLQQSSHHELWIISSGPSPTANRKGARLVPFLSWSTTHQGKQMRSNTTRQPGIVSNLDLAPSIFNYFDVKPLTEWSGSVWRYHTAEADYETFRSHLDYIFKIYFQRGSVLKMYISFIIISLLSSTLYSWLFNKRKGIHVVQVVMGSVLLSPLFFLWLTPLIEAVNEWIWIFILLLLSLLTSYFMYRLHAHVLFITLLGGLNTAVIMIDLLRGSEWMKRSFLGYDPIIGARFYGLGNEYAGILLGSSILLVTGMYVWLRKENKRTALLSEERLKQLYFLLSTFVYIVILYLISAPQYGTNAGAALASLFTYAGAQMLLFKVRINGKQIGLLLLFLLASLTFFVLYHLKSDHTHIGAFFEQLFYGDASVALEVIQRKWEMNLKLIRKSLWGKLFLICMVVLIFISFWLVKKTNDYSELAHWMSGFRAIVLGAFLILILNDSGIVAAATTILYAVFPYLMVYQLYGESQETLFET